MESTQIVMKVSLQPSQQLVELVGSESPSAISLNPKNQRSRHDLSRARLRALESSLENGRLWVPPSPSHRKTWEEQVRSTNIVTTKILFSSEVLWCCITDKLQNIMIWRRILSGYYMIISSSESLLTRNAMFYLTVCNELRWNLEI